MGFSLHRWDERSPVSCTATLASMPRGLAGGVAAVPLRGSEERGVEPPHTKTAEARVPGSLTGLISRRPRNWGWVQSGTILGGSSASISRGVPMGVRRTYHLPVNGLAHASEVREECRK